MSCSKCNMWIEIGKEHDCNSTIPTVIFFTNQHTELAEDELSRLNIYFDTVGGFFERLWQMEMCSPSEREKIIDVATKHNLNYEIYK